MVVKKYIPQIAVTQEDRNDYYKNKYGGLLQEEFKGEVIKKDKTFPKDLGEEHPFDFKDTENVVKHFGILNGIVDKYVDSIVGDFSIKVKNPNVQAIINSFIKDTDFPIQLRAWIREAIIKGNGFMELDLDSSKIRVLNANQIYVKRDKKGKVEKYNQWMGDAKRLTRDFSKITPLDINKIAHLPINQFAGEAYGYGLVFSNLTTTNFLMGNEVDVHKLITRKAGSPIHVKLGQPGESISKEDIDQFKSDLQFMQTRTEWVTDGSIEMSVIDFKDLPKNLIETINHDLFMLSSGMQIPEVLMGSGQLNEGIAKVQLEGWQRKGRSIQEQIESIVEEKIFKPLLIAQGFEESVDFLWNLPGEEEKNKRIEQLRSLLDGSVLIDENLRRMVQIEIARVLDFDEADIQKLREPEVGLDDKKEEEKKLETQNSPEAQKEKDIPQPEVPGAKPNANEKHEHFNCMHGAGCGQQLSESEINDMSLKDWVNLQEFERFNYTDYLISILQLIKRDGFDNLLAKTELDLIEGLLPPSEIEKLRVILKSGFKDNKTIRQIEREISDNIPLTDRLKDGKLIASAASRPNNIARTETVRLANQGLLNHYQDNQIEKVRFLAALSERTCPQCEELNARVFNLNESYGIIPVHPMCRCTWVPIIT